MLCAVISGADTFNDIELFAKCKAPFFESFLELPGGIPSHDTLNRVISSLDTQQFSECFAKWIRNLSLKGVIAIDGKTERRSFNNLDKRDSIHMVSAWCSDLGIVLGQTVTDQKSNEITAIPELLNILDTQGCTVTIDAMGCQTEIAQKILDKKGNYLFSLKGNQGNTLDTVEHLFKWEEKNGYESVQSTNGTTVEKDHGRIETRKVTVITDLESLDLPSLDKWPSLRSVVKVDSTRETAGQRTFESRYYITSISGTAKKIGSQIRSHWGFENSLHWVLDMVFNEDQLRNRAKNSAANMTVIRHMALNLIKQDKNTKVSIRGRRLKAGWDDAYLLGLLQNI